MNERMTTSISACVGEVRGSVFFESHTGLLLFVVWEVGNVGVAGVGNDAPSPHSYGDCEIVSDGLSVRRASGCAFLLDLLRKNDDDAF